MPGPSASTRRHVENAPLGVFDSGLGGLTVVHALRQALPRESILYLGDTARVPYGTRSPDTVIRYARGCAKTLTERGVKALVIACNTASAVAVDALRQELDVPVLGVVEPGARAAVSLAGDLEAVHPLLEGAASSRITVGVLGTAGTVSSGAYPAAVHAIAPHVDVVGAPAPLLVPLVEEGWTEGEVPRLAVRRYVEPLLAANAAVLVLGCTHYPLLKSLIRDVAREISGVEIPVVDSAEATAAEVARWVDEGRLAKAAGAAGGTLKLMVTDRPNSFSSVARRFLAEPLPQPELVDLAAV